MKLLNKAICLSLGLGLAFSSTVFAQKEIKIGYAVSHNSHYGDGADAFCSTLEKETDSRYICKQFPNATLGNEREMAEDAQLGALDVAFISSGTVGNFVPEMKVVDIPFLFKDYEHARSVLDSHIGQELLDQFPKKGLIALAWGENGFRHITNNIRKIETPNDLKDIKLRTMENKIHITSFRDLGVLPTPMAWPEVYTALQQGTIDGQENPLAILLTAKLWQVQKHLALTSHVYSPTLLLASPKLWNSLDDKDKSALKASAKAASNAQRSRVDKDENKAISIAEENGMEVSRPNSLDFQKTLESTFNSFGKEYGSILKEIQEFQ